MSGGLNAWNKLLAVLEGIFCIFIYMVLSTVIYIFFPFSEPVCYISSALITVGVLFGIYSGISGSGSLSRVFAFRKTNISLFVLTFCCGVFFNVLTAVGVSFLEFLIPSSWIDQNQESVASATQGNPWLALIVIGIAAPLVEEVIFRGVFYTRLRNASSFWFAAIVTSLAFAILHANPLQAIYTFCVGLLLCYVRERANTLWVPIFLHSGYNLSSIIIQSAYNAMPIAVLFLFSLLICFVLLYFFYQRTKTEPAKRET